MGKAVAAKADKFTSVNCNYVVDESHVPLVVGAIGNLLGHGNENLVTTTKYTIFTFLPRGTHPRGRGGARPPADPAPPPAAL